jgi:S-adenosylmethionine decarboxylase
MNDASPNAFGAPQARPLGQHLIAEFYGATALYDPEPARQILENAALAAGATVLRIDAHDFGAREGFTAVAVLAESHISLHTWPEHGYLALDVFMCGAADVRAALQILEDYFRPARSDVQIIERGVPAFLAAAL